jgi:hypothetical protein
MTITGLALGLTYAYSPYCLIFTSSPTAQPPVPSWPVAREHVQVHFDAHESCPSLCRLHALMNDASAPPNARLRARGAGGGVGDVYQCVATLSATRSTCEACPAQLRWEQASFGGNNRDLLNQVWIARLSVSPTPRLLLSREPTYRTIPLLATFLFISAISSSMSFYTLLSIEYI